MDAILERCAGLDVHQATVVACVLTGELDHKPKQTVQTFGTTTEDLIKLRDWLLSHHITHAAMESTGVYWIPVWNILEGSFQLVLGNARLIKNVPGRKTDVKDAVWIAQLLRCGLISGSFIPPEVIRQLRNFTRYRYKLNGQVTAEKNRVQKMLETANIKLASFITDVFGVSGMSLLEAIVDGECLDVEQVRQLVQTQMKSKVPQLIKALNGRINLHHRGMIRMHLEHLDFLQQQVAKLDAQIAALLEPFNEQIQLLDTIPGINETSAAYILAEIGVDVGATFPTDAHLSSWAGVSPGQNESAGKKKSAKTPKGKRVLKAILCQCAWASSFTSNTRIKAFYDRVVKRRGKKKANMAVAHLLIRLIYHVLTTKKPYHEIGYAYLFNQASQEYIWISKLQALGYEVHKPQAS